MEGTSPNEEKNIYKKILKVDPGILKFLKNLLVFREIFTFLMT